MPTSDFQLFADAVGANVVDQAAYLAATWRTAGFLAGIAPSAQLNKVWRQSAFVTAALAQLTSTTLNADVLDNGDLNAFIAQLQAAIGIAAAARSARIVTASTALNVLITDYAIGFNRTVAPAATAVALPNPGANVGQSFKLDDLVGNFNQFPVTVTPPAGHSIAGLATYVMNEDRGSNEFRWFGSNLWGVE